MDYISVGVIISSDKDYSKIITEKLNIMPTKTINKDNIKLAAYQHYEWQYKVEKNANTVSEVFDYMLDILEGKESTINDCVSVANGNICFVVTVHAVNDKPEVILPKRVIDFAYKIGAEIHFDLYYF